MTRMDGNVALWNRKMWQKQGRKEVETVETVTVCDDDGAMGHWGTVVWWIWHAHNIETTWVWFLVYPAFLCNTSQQGIRNVSGNGIFDMVDQTCKSLGWVMHLSIDWHLLSVGSWKVRWPWIVLNRKNWAAKSPEGSRLQWCHHLSAWDRRGIKRWILDIGETESISWWQGWMEIWH